MDSKEKPGSVSAQFGPGSEWKPANSVTNLRCGCNMGSWKADIRGPGDVSNPIVMAPNHFVFDPLLGLFVKSPYADQIVGSRGYEALLRNQLPGLLTLG
jgi:hypothetical protein